MIPYRKLGRLCVAPWQGALLLFAFPVYAISPSFNCAKASTADELAICSSSELSELDNLVAVGFNFVRLHFGKIKALSIAGPLLKLRQACGADQGCIHQRQIDAIQAYQRLGAPVRIPQWASGTSSKPVGLSSNFAAISHLPCTSYLRDYDRSSVFSEAVASYMSDAGAEGNVPNMVDSAACECRLHEQKTIGEAVSIALAILKSGHFIAVPIGGTATPAEQKEGEEFGRWIHHNGPRPYFKASGLACNSSKRF